MNKLNNYLNQMRQLEIHYIGDESNPVGWQAVCYDCDNTPLGGGLAKTIELAKRIAISEYCERNAFFEILKCPSLSSDFEMNNHPTTCGFAAGFERDKTKLRSIAESLERWAWSKWIDEGYRLEKVDEIKHTEISKYLIKHFDDYLVFRNKFELNNPQKVEFQLLVFIGIRDGGVFPGSRVCTMGENPFEHAIVEAFRHLKINEQDNDKTNFPYNRINYFAKNKDVALAQVDRAKKSVWPKFSLKLIKEYDTKIEGLFVFRAIAHDFIPWNEGDTSRFVY